MKQSNVSYSLCVTLYQMTHRPVLVQNSSSSSLTGLFMHLGVDFNTQYVSIWVCELTSINPVKIKLFISHLSCKRASGLPDKMWWFVMCGSFYSWQNLCLCGVWAALLSVCCQICFDCLAHTHARTHAHTHTTRRSSLAASCRHSWGAPLSCWPLCIWTRPR